MVPARRDGRWFVDQASGPTPLASRDDRRAPDVFVTAVRTRREPPTFRTVAVRRTEALTPRLLRVTVGGDELAGLTVDLPAASVRLLLPSAGRADLVMPSWNGNEFLLPDGSRPIIRTLTPRHVETAGRTLDVDVVIHEGGALSAWAQAARPGDPVAVSGPGRGYAVDPAAGRYLLAGDETAIPAISQLLEHLPDGLPVQVLVEVADPAARLPLTSPASGRDDVEVTWCDLPPGAPPGDALVAAVGSATEAVDPATRIWVAGEAAAVQRIRRALFQDRGVPRAHAAVRGYWRHGRAGDGDGGE
jgi:NADPH-dependent ferric siderophore reductase